MTKQEVNEIISSKAAEYGFEIEENSMGWNNNRTGQDYINIQIFQNSNIEKTDWEKRIGCIEIEASASVSRMGGSPKPEEQTYCKQNSLPVKEAVLLNKASLI